MLLDKLQLFGGYFRAYSSEPYEDTMRATENLASSSLLLLEGMSEAENGKSSIRRRTCARTFQRP